MASAARFIVSLDCEGKWGMADHLQDYHHRLLTSDALAAAYRQLVTIFDRFQVSATFAFVMAFVLTSEERERFSSDLLGNENDAWLRPYREAVATRRIDGWHQPAALEIVREAGVHEIACHSFCHRPLGECSISDAGADRDLAVAVEVGRLKSLTLETFVFPRNEVGHVDVLRSHGFIGYRERLHRPGGSAGRALSLAEELNVWAAPQRPIPPAKGLVPIPSGRFLNWRFGARALVPPSLTRARWRHQLRSAARTGEIVHLWLHPHNLITGPRTASLLEGIISDVAAMRDRGEVRILTQREYCREMLQQDGDPAA